MTTPTSSTAFYRHLPLQVKKLSANAVLPTRGSQYAAGLDLASAADVIIGAGQRALVPTDLAIACPPGTYARIAPRSGLAYKHGIDVGAGVIDADYRGPVGVILFNFGSSDFAIKSGDRIAQLILEQIVAAEVVICDELPKVGDRGSNGFGSTGIEQKPDFEVLDSDKDDDSNSKKQRMISPQNSSDEN